MSYALNNLSIADGHKVCHLTEKFEPNTVDIDWITSLSKEGGWIIVSQDHLRKSDAEKEALRRSGLVVFFLAKQWSNHQHWDKAAQLVRWWPAIIKQSEHISGGASFKVPWRFSGKGKFEQIS